MARPDSLAPGRAIHFAFETAPGDLVLAFTDGITVLPMEAAQDHKAVFDGDQGPNTGGMGAYSPAPIFTPELKQLVIDQIMVPAVNGMRADGIPYQGVLYAGLMITPNGPKTLEFNARFGDPETQTRIAAYEMAFRMQASVPELTDLSDARGRASP